MLIGCDAYSVDKGTVRNPDRSRLLYRATEGPKEEGLSKNEIIAIGVIVPSAVITVVLASWCYWVNRAKEQRRKTMLPAYEDCLRESRPPAYSPSPEPGSDGEELRRETRSPPPDYAASTETLPARPGHEPEETVEPELEPSGLRHESYVLQELDRSAVDELRRGRENTDGRGT
jgi:hypothetical protein